jgi:hypothetical protein
MLTRWAIAALPALLCGFPVFGQTASGTLAGVVRDVSGSPIAAAAVKVTNAAGAARDGSTDAQGAFRISNLAAGTYDITIAKESFRTREEFDIRVEAGHTVNLALRLDVDSVSASVDVTAKGELAEIGDKAINDLFNFTELFDLVQDSRDVTELAYLRLGVSRRASGGLGSGYVVGGARADNTNFIVDGFSDYDPRTGGAQLVPNYDAIEEFRVQTSGNTAEYGRLAGGVMNMILRSGSNRPHFSMFEFFRPSAPAARNFFDVEKSAVDRNQFGATVSGPVVIPGLYSGRDRTFFLASWEGLIQSMGQNRLSNVPTALERAGDFSRSLDSFGAPVVINDPLTGAPFPGKQIPAARFDPVAQRLIPFYPLPNRNDPLSDYQTNQLNRARWNSLLLKIDEYPTDKTRVSFRFVTRIGATRSPYNGSDLGTFANDGHSRPTLAGINVTRVLATSLVNEFRAGFVRTSDHEFSQYNGIDMNAQLGLPALTTDPRLIGFPRFTVLNLATLGDDPSRPYNFTINNYEAADALTWNHGRHFLKFGGDWLRTQFFQQLYNNVRGSYNFLGRWTNVPFADLLLGLPDSTSRQSTSSPAYLFSTDWGVFVQDEFAVTGRLTLNIGMRYEFKAPPVEKYGRFSSFVQELGEVVIADGRTIPDLTQRIATAGLTGKVVTADQAHLPQSLVYSNRGDIAPRFGFAYKPFRKAGTVVRGGYGIYYADSLLDPIRNDLTNVYPFNVSQTFNRVAGRPASLTLENPFPPALATLPGVTNVNGMTLHPRPQYLQSYTVSIERQIDSATMLEVDYAGSRGTHLAERYDVNQPYRTLAQRLPNGTFPRPYGAFGTINFYGFGGNSVYNEGSVMLRRRFQRGLFYGITYVFSKSIDNASQVSGNSAGDYPGAQDSRDLLAERGRSDWDTGHSLMVFGSYNLPFRTNPLLRRWQISTTTRLYTGQPFTPRLANSNLTLGEANRPDRIGKGTLPDPNVNNWFDLSAFPPVARGAFRFGDSGRNILDGPGNITVNGALIRSFRVADRVNLYFRGEAINVLNHANLGLPVNYVDVRNAGQILTADAGRVIQFGFRLQF